MRQNIPVAASMIGPRRSFPIDKKMVERERTRAIAACAYCGEVTDDGVFRNLNPELSPTRFDKVAGREHFANITQ